MKELNRFFESIYKESLSKLTEIEASTMSSLIRKHMATEKDALAYAKKLGEKVAKNYDSDFKDDKRPFIKKWFELFYTTIKANGIPFAPFTELEVA